MPRLTRQDHRTKAVAVLMLFGLLRAGLLAAPSAELGTTLPRSEVAQVPAAKAVERYQTAGAPDADQVRRVVATLGPNRNVKLQTTDGKRWRGRIEAIGQGGVSLSQSGTVSEEIPYGTITRIERAKPVWPKVVTIAAVATGGFFLIAFLVLSGQDGY